MARPAPHQHILPFGLAALELRPALPDAPTTVDDKIVTGDPAPCIGCEQSYGLSNCLLSLSVRSAGSYQPCAAYWLVCR